LLAHRLLAGPGDDAARVDRLWLRACSRPPTAHERDAANAALAEWAGDVTAARREEAWARLCHALLGSSAFLFRL